MGLRGKLPASFSPYCISFTTGNMFTKHRKTHVFFAIVATIILVSALCAGQANNSSISEQYVPAEFQASDPEIKKLLDAALKSAAEGKYTERTHQLQKALALCSQKALVADKAIVEDSLGVAYFTEGNLDEAKKQWLASLSDAINSSNLVVEADVLVALSAMAEAAGPGNLASSLELMARATQLAGKSKNFYIQARVLGESGRLQLVAGNRKEARESIERALQIDRLNKYDWEPSHLLYLAWTTAAEPNTGQESSIGILKEARDMAIEKNNYIVFVQAATALGQAYVRKGELDLGINTLEHARNGTSETNAPLFKNPDTYRAAVALPFFTCGVFRCSGASVSNSPSLR